MSLYKQLWIAVGALLLVVFGATFAINGVSSSRYLEKQLTLKNADDATRFALTLSQQNLDPILLEVQLTTLLDQGSYEYIEFRDPNGKVVFSRGNLLTEDQTPDWIKDLFPIHSLPGVANVDSAWNQLGTLSLKSHDGFAYDELWAGGRRTLLALVVAIVIAGVLGTMLLRVILNPLNDVVSQAQAIGQRRFITIPEPFTTEFAEVTRSMNELSRRIREMLSRESQRLARQREVSDLDPNTGILQREPFMGRLRAKLESEGADANGSVAMVRLGDLAGMNQIFGRQPMDSVLKGIGGALRRLTITESEWSVGRLNGSDFCLLAPQEDHPKKVGEALQRIIMEVLRENSMQDKTTLPTACIEYASGDTIAQIMTGLDGALLAADEEGNSPVNIASRGSGTVLPVREQANQWREELTKALEDNRLLIETYPVVDNHGQLIHAEGMVRIRIKDQIRSAGEFMPWVHRLDLGGEVDRAVVRLAIKNIERTGHPTCANLTVASLTDTTFAVWLEEFLFEHRDSAAQLSIEVGEAAAYTHSEGFRRLSQRAHALNVKIGVEHMGYRISDIGKLGELGMDYIKIDGLFVRDIDTNLGNQALFRTYANIAQSLGLSCIAEGVSSAAEMDAAFELGASGVCGKAIQNHS